MRKAFFLGRYALSLALLILAATLLMVRQTQEKAQQRRQLLRTYVSSLTAQQIRNFLTERGADLRFLSERYSANPKSPQEFERSAQLIFQNHPEYQCIKEVDPAGTIRWACVRSSASPGKDESAFSTPERKGFFDQVAAQSQQVVMSNVMPLYTGVQGVLLAKRLGKDPGPSRGLVYAALSFQSILDCCVDPEWKKDFSPTISFGMGPNDRSPDSYARDEFQIFGQTVRLDMVPKSTTWPEGPWNAPVLVLAVGGTLSFLIGFLAWRLEREESRAREASERLRTVLEHSYDIIWSCDGDGCFTFISPAFRDILGYSEQKVLGHPVSGFVHPEDLPRLSEVFQKLRKGKTVNRSILRFQRENGGRLYMESTVSPTLNPQGRIIRFDGASRDVTERWQAEERYRRLIETSEDLVFEADGGGKILFANSAFKAVLGLDPGSLPGRSFWDLVPEDIRDRTQRSSQAKLAGSGSADFRLRLEHADGGERHLSVHLRTETDRSGALPGFRGVGRDLTTEKKLENQMLQFQKMDAVGKLAGGMAHDFNNLLTVILSHAEGASEGLPEDSPIRRDLDLIRKAGRRAAELTRQVLTFSRRHPVEPTELHLNAVALDLEAFLKRLLPPGMELEVQVSEDLDWIMADRGQMEQVLMNLVLNAKDAMPGGGVIRVATRNVQLAEPLSQGPNFLNPGRWVVLEVRDQGQGIPEEHLERIFEPFYTTKETGRGTGLGLSVVYGIVRSHQGGLHVETESGKGTTVRVFLPVVDPLDQGAALSGGQSILLLEPDEFNRKILRRLLESMGYPVLTADSVESAQALAHRPGYRFDLLFAAESEPGGASRALAVLRGAQPDLRLVRLGRSGPLEETQGPHGPILAPPYDVERVAAAIQDALETDPPD